MVSNVVGNMVGTCSVNDEYRLVSGQYVPVVVVGTASGQYVVGKWLVWSVCDWSVLGKWSISG